MRHTVLLHIAKDQWVLEVFGPRQESGLNGVLSKANAFLLGKPHLADTAAHRMILPIQSPQAQEDWRPLFQRCLSTLNHKVALPLAQCDLDVRLGADFSHVGLFKPHTVNNARPTSGEVDAFARVWIEQTWALTFNEQVTRIESFGAAGHYLVTCIRQAIPTAAQEVCSAMGIRLQRITPTFLHLLDTWIQSGITGSPNLAASSTKQSDRILVLVERGISDSHGQAIQIAVTQEGALKALSRVWFDASMVANLLTGNATLVKPIVRRLVASSGNQAQHQLQTSTWPDTLPLGRGVPLEKVDA